MSEPDDVGEVLVLSTDSALGLNVVEILGLVHGVGTGWGEASRAKTERAYGRALEQLRTDAWSMGADTVVGVRQSSHGARRAALLGDACVVVLSGTAVRTG